MRKLLRGNKGLTLIELIVVMVILAVLASIVTAGVLGSKSRSEDTQVKADAYNVQDAVQRFNNESSQNVWPDAATNKVTGIKGAVAEYDGIAMYDTDGTTALNNGGDYTTIDWAASMKVRDSSGALVGRKLVPDFLSHKPANADWLQGGKAVYAWVMLKGSVLDGAATRTVQIFKLNADGTKYIKIYPE